MSYHPRAIVEIHENLMKGDPGCHFKFMMPAEGPEEQIDKSVLRALENRVRENPVAFMRLMLRREAHVVGMLYYSIAGAIIDRFDSDGKAMVEASLNEMGKRRGRELKSRLDRDGVEVTWTNIFDHFDLGYKFAWKMKQRETSDHRLFLADVEDCPLAEIWKDLGDHELGSLYCDTMYRAMFREIHPEAEVSIPLCMSKGAIKCRFEFKI
jgi:hypothetical protein